MNLKNKILHPELIFIGLMLFIVIFQLLIPPVIGLADNGDFSRITKWGGLITGSDYIYSSYINTKYLTGGNYSVGYISSEAIVFFIAKLFSIFSSQHYFDIRFIGLTHTLFFIASMALIMFSFRKIPLRYFLFVLVLLIFTDVGYISYFNSFYCDPASFNFLFLFIGFAAMVIFQKSYHPLVLFGLIVSSVLFVTAKAQNSLSGIFIFIFMLGLSRINNAKRYLVFGSIVVLAVSLVTFINPQFKKENLYNAVFYGILRYSPTPQADLITLGLNPKFVALAGTSAPEESKLIFTPEFRRDFYERIGFGKIIGFYLSHPGRLLAKLDLAAHNAYTIRPAYLGNYEKNVGVPRGTQSKTFSIWSTVKNQLFPKSIWFLAAFFGLNTIISFVLCFRSQSYDNREITDLIILLTAMALAQFATGVIGDGDYELAKHLFLFNVLFDIILIVDIYWIFLKLWKLVIRRNGNV